MKEKINIVTLGCSKNSIDSEFLARQIEINGLQPIFDSNNLDAKTVIINTCGFIQDAKEESIETILRFVDAKKKGDIKQIIVSGCLSQRYKKDLINELPEVDHFFGKFDYKNLLQTLKLNYDKKYATQRKLITPSHYAYLKISEGCNRSCSFCAIPSMTGKHTSKPIEHIIDEARDLTQKGVKEILLIAQDLSYYGIDIYKKPQLAQLVDELAKINGIEWIKLHYAYPAGFPLDILDIISQNPKVCNYLDIALQHSSDKMLKLMRRHITKEQTYKLIGTIRARIPDIVLRTTLITGHPGETEDDFQQLVQFVDDIKFERLGVFTYSHEENTFAYENFEDSVEEEVKEQRKEVIMTRQQEISQEFLLGMVGKTLKVIIDRAEENYFVGRTAFDSPEVDGEVLISKNKYDMLIGNFYDVKITSSSDYDLFAE